MKKPFLTAALPGAGGLFKATPEDFVVEELPAYLPSGEGEHLYLLIEKRGLNTQDVVTFLSEALPVPEGEIGYAGQKDRQSVSRQRFSIPARLEPKVAALSHEKLTVLEAKRHGNKLRTGHLKGNRFILTLRGVERPEVIDTCLAELSKTGVPNWFGEQRFGRAGDNAENGKRLLLGERLPKRPSKFERKLFLSAFQSELFNRLLAERLEKGELSTALFGDVLEKEDSGGAFVCEDPAVDQPRVDGLLVHPTGPLFGPKMMSPKGEVALREAAVLAEAGVDLAAFERGRDETQGARRPYRALLGEPLVERPGEEGLVRVSFSLPKGSYATSVVRELLKLDV